MYLLNIFLFLITLIGGSIPLWSKRWTEQHMKYLLAFSGAYLLSVTMLHLVPEVVENMGHWSGVLIIAGFFLQQFLQPFTHGVEHGHAHIHHDHDPINIWPLFIGLGFHAFMEGIPLGNDYHDTATVPSLFLAIALHKIPEAMLIGSLVYFSGKSLKKAWILLIIFSLLTPVSSYLTTLGRENMEHFGKIIGYIIPVVAGAFLHISTTIFFESGTKKHEMDWKKWLTIFLAIGLALITILSGDGGHHHH